MAYTYHDWMTQTTDALRLTRLRQHIAEVSALVQPDVAAQGSSRSTGALQPYLADLYKQEERLARVTGERGGRSVGYVRVTG